MWMEAHASVGEPFGSAQNKGAVEHGRFENKSHFFRGGGPKGYLNMLKLGQ